MNDVLLAGLWQGAFVAAIAWLVTCFVPQRSAATRYAIWFAALVALLVLPLAELWHPQEPSVLPPAVAGTVVATTVATGRAASAGGWVLLLVWLAGVVFFSARIAFSYFRIRRIIRDAVPAPSLGSDVLLSGDLVMPIAAGFARGVVLIPQHMARTLDAVDLANLVRHERAHLARRDVAQNLVQRCIEAVLFFNPWVHLVGRALVSQREAACDDWAVYLGAQPERYASCLAKLARNAPARTPLLTPSAIGSRRMLFTRVTRLLNGKATELKVNYIALGGAVAAFAFLGVGLQASNGIALGAPAAPRIAARNNCNHPAKVLNPVPPALTQADRTALGHRSVWANVLVTVASDGSVVSAKIVRSSGFEGVDRATLDAARHSTYAPAMADCKAAPGQYVFHAVFSAAP